MKLRRSALVLFLFFSLVPLCLFGVFSIYEMNRKIADMTECNLEAVSENQVANIQKFADDRKNDMEMLANYDLVQDAIRYSLGESEVIVNRKYLDNLLREQKKYGTFVASVSVLNKNFQVVGSSENYDLSETSQLRDVNQKFHTGEFIIGNVYERETDDGLKRIVPAYIGVYSGGSLIGYISEELDTTYFDELRLNMDSLTAGTFYLLDGENAIITAGTTVQKESLREFVTKNDERNDFHEKWCAIDHEENPTGKIYYTYNHEKYITYYSNVENTEWTIRMTENLTAQQKEMKSYSLLFILVLCVFSFAVVVVQMYLTKKISQPIQAALDVFAEIQATQNYSLRMPMNSQDEMGKLSAGINALLAYIEDENIQEKMTQRKLKKQAESDPLTGVKNKKAMEKYVMDKVHAAAETGTQIMLGFLDIDDFRSFNTNYGHREGDAVIRYVARMLGEHISGEVGRIGGDEFLFCYTGETDACKVKADADMLFRALAEDYIGIENGKHIPITCSLGIVIAGGSNLDYTELVHQADKAMYQAKDAGKNTVVVADYSGGRMTTR